MFDFKLVDIAGAVILLLLIGSVWTIIVATPEVAQTPEPPNSNWSINDVNETYTIISHEGGEPVNKDNLSVIVGEHSRSVEWSGSKDSFVRENDSTMLQVSRDQTVALYWTGIDTVQKRVLATSSR
jgi:hypothetical protein